MNWIFDFLVSYTNTPNYLHTMVDNTLYLVIIFVPLLVLMCAICGVVYIYGKIKDKRKNKR